MDLALGGDREDLRLNLKSFLLNKNRNKTQRNTDVGIGTLMVTLLSSGLCG